MPRLLVHVEGQTEESFVNNVLSAHLYNAGFTAVGARLLGNARQRSRRGGIKPWDAVRRDIIGHLKNDAGCLATTFVDYYALPNTWPGRQAATHLPFGQKARAIEVAIAEDIAGEMGPGFQTNRFVPFIVMHEYEGLLFSDCTAFALSIGQPRVQHQLQAIRDAFESPEHINDSPLTAPSKRILKVCPSYQKPLFGAIAAQSIGLTRIREHCPLFSEWVSTLEASVAS